MPTPKSLYIRRIKDGGLQTDPLQEQVVEALQTLYEDILQDHNSKPAHKFLEPFRSFFNQKNNSIPGLYIYGGVGRGKSMLMDLFYDCLPDDVSKQRIHFHQFMINVHDYIHTMRGQEGGAGVDEALPLLAEKIYGESRILCFDEFHVTDVTDAMILGRLFRHLFERGVVVVATSNWAPDDLYKGGLQRERFLPFIDLLKEKMKVLHLDSPIDYRQEFLHREGAYFYPLNPQTDRSIQSLYNKLTNQTGKGGIFGKQKKGSKDTGQVLIVKGREIPITKSVGKVARFTFQDLCEKPYGAEDYLAIAERYNIVFLEHIPVLKYDRRNELKRLIILIDAFYENKVRLVISAAAAPEKLCLGSDHAFEFERTVSRLKEMQSPDYLGEDFIKYL